MKSKQLWLYGAVGLFAATSLRGNEGSEPTWVELDAFIVEESGRLQAETMSPLSMNVTGLGAGTQSVAAIPRSVSVLSAQLMDMLGIDSYDQLERFGAGTQRINYFGLAGSAFLRGMRAGTYFNGILRAYQRNEMPMSFGALEGLEIVKGPVPAAWSPTMVGGGVNQRPKSPYFDRSRGSVELGIGSWQEWSLQLDFGAPLMLMGKPAAYRFSANIQRADRFYDDVPHAQESLYAAVRMRLSERTRLFAGAEYFNFRSSEIPGINRPTAALIRDRSYVIGEPPDLTSSQWGGQTVRTLLEFPFSLVVNPALHALAIPGDLARAAIAPELRAHMLDLNDPAVIQSLYSVRPVEAIPHFALGVHATAIALLAKVDQSPQDAYLYTPDYFAAGGEALTVTLPRQRVLADPDDRADSRDLIAFSDFETRLSPDTIWLNRIFYEQLSSGKYSTYGFAFRSNQRVVHLRSELQHASAGPAAILNVRSAGFFSAGIDLRFTDAQALQDFDAEPFSRRDLSLPTISPNSQVIAGGLRGPDGLNYWSTFGTASEQSELLQAALFAGGHFAVGEHWTLHYGLRAENAWWKTALPDAVDRVAADDRRSRSRNGDTFLYAVHLNPHVRIIPGLYGYGAVQFSKALAPGDGGTVSGEISFTDAELYEAGFKWDGFGGRLFSSLAIYYWDQATFSSRDAAAQPLRANGVEWEVFAQLHARFTLIGAVTAQRVYYRSKLLGFGSLPMDEAGWALNAGILNAASNRSAPNNPRMAYAGMPERSAHLYAVWEPLDRLQLAAGPLWRDGFYHDMQRSLYIPGSTVWMAYMRLRTERAWIQLRVDNLFNRDYWIGQEPVFSANTLILQGEGRTYELRAGWSF